MELVMMRHGETEANAKHVYAGRTDTPLSREGERQARKAGRIEEVGLVYASSLSRARRTAEICFPRARLVEVAGLGELDFGAFEGRSAADMEGDPAYREWVAGYCEGTCPGGECRADLVARVSAAIGRIVGEARERGDARIVVVGHGGTLMAAMSAFGNPSADYFSWQVGNCEGYRVQVSPGEGSVRFSSWERFGDLSFMRTGCAAEPSAHSFFSNTACKYFPCHEGVAPDEFNCLFCYCPLYALGPACGGDFTYTESGRKNCTACVKPHVRDAGADLVARRFNELAELAAPRA